MQQQDNQEAQGGTGTAEPSTVMIDTGNDVPMTGDPREDGFVDPTNSPKSSQPLTPAEQKVNMWKKMILQGLCMAEILEELRDKRPPLTAKQLRVIFTLLLDRVYNQKEAKEQHLVCDFFAEELTLMLGQESISGDDIDQISFIFTETHSIFNYRVSSNGPQLAQRLAKARYPDSEEAAQRDTDFLQALCEKNVAYFSQYFAHLALRLQTGASGGAGDFERLVRAAGQLSITALVQVIGLLTRLRKFIRGDTWASLAATLSEVCQSVSLQDSAETKRLSKKEILDFTDNLERVLLHAYNASTKKSAGSPIDEEMKTDVELTEEQKAEQAAQKAEQAALEDARRRDFVYRVPELIQLEFAIRCLEMPVLEKKLTGATLLIMKVVSVSAKKGGASQANSQGNDLKMKKWLTAEAMIEWLREKKIFGVFFGTSLHPEVIKKAFYLLDFLYQQGELTERELQKMWHIATKKHEAFKVSIMRALIFMASRMAPKELNFLFGKLQAMQLREHDKFSLALLKSIAKALAPTQKETQKKQAGSNSGYNAGNDRLGGLFAPKKARSRPGSVDGQKPTGDLDAGTKRRNGLLLGNLDLLDGGKKKRRGSNDSTRVNFDLEPEPERRPVQRRRQKSFSPEPRKTGQRRGSGGLNFDFKMPPVNDEDDADLQAALAMSLAAAEAEVSTPQQPDTTVPQDAIAPAPQSPQQPAANRNRNAEFEIRAEDLFDVPIEKQSQATAEGDFSPERTDEEEAGSGAVIAARALDLPISSSHSPQTADNIPIAQSSSKPKDEEDKRRDEAEDDQQDIKVVIGDHFYGDNTLGLVNSDDEVARRDLAQQVLDFMWQLCLDDSVFGGQQPNNALPFESQSAPRTQGRFDNNSASNRIEASLRPRKGLSVQSHQVCIDQFAEVINYNYPSAWFPYIQESTRRLKANMQGMTMQLIIKKLLLGTQFPMIEAPAKPEALAQLDGDLSDETYVASLAADLQQAVAAHKEQGRRVKSLPRTRVVLLKTLEEEIGLTGACLSSYICFKSEALQLIYAYNFGNVHEEEYLETQSSLDGDDDKLMQNTSVTSGGDLVGQPSSSEPRSSAVQLMDVDIGSEGQATHDFASSIDPNRINDRLNQQVMQVATRMHGRSDTHSLEEGKEEYKQPSSARLPNRGSGHINQIAAAAASGGGRDTRSFLDTMVTNRVYNYSFAREMNERLDFLRFLVAQSPESMLKPQQIQIMWECLVSNAYYEKERDMFFGWCTEILLAARKKQNARQSNGFFEDSNDFFSDDCLELLFFDTLLKLDFRFFTESIYACFENFFIHVNEQYGQIVTTFGTQLEIFDFKLIGIEALIEIVLQVRDSKVQEKASAFLMKIYKSLNKELMEQKIAEIKQDLLSICMGNVRKGQQELSDTEASQLMRQEAEYSLQAMTASDHQNRVARSIKILSKFIEQFEGYKDYQAKKGGSAAFSELGDPEVKVVVHNQVSKTEGPTKFDMKLRANSTTVQMIMEQVSSTIHPKRDINELTLTYKGKDLKENLKTLKQVMGTAFGKIDQCVMILSSKSSIEMEYMEQDLAIFGTKIETSQFDPAVLSSKVAELKMFLGETEASDEVIALALKKCNLNLEETIGLVITEESIAELQAELIKEQEDERERNLMVIAPEAPKAAAEVENEEGEQPFEEDKLNLIVSNKAEYFDMLFELLNLGVPDVTQAVWKLMMQVPINQKLFNSMWSLHSIHAEQPMEASEANQLVVADNLTGWQSIIDPNSPYKMLYSLQILNTLVSVNNQVLTDVEMQERYEWRQRFLELGGVTHLYSILITSDVSEMIAPSTAQVGGQGAQAANKKFGHAPQRHSKKQRAKLIKGGSMQGFVEEVAPKKVQGNQIDQARCLSFLISIVKIFLHAALLTVDYENLLNLVVQSSTSPFRNDRRKGVAGATDDPAKGQQLEQLVAQGLADKPNRANNSYGREFGGSDAGSRAGNTSGPGTPTFGSDHGGGAKTPTDDKPAQSNTSTSSINVRPKNTYTQVDDFPRLVEQMKQNGIAQLLLDQVIDFSELMRKLLQIIYTAVIYQDEQQNKQSSQKTAESTGNNLEHNPNEALSELLQHALDLMLPCLIWQPELLLREIYDFANLEKLLIRALTHTQDESARKAVERTFRTICTHKLQVNRGLSMNAFDSGTMQDSSPANRDISAIGQQSPEEAGGQRKLQSPKVHILKILLKNLPSQSTQSTHCEEFFNLIASIIRASSESFILESDELLANNNDISALTTAQQPNTPTIDLARLIVSDEPIQFSASYLLQVFVEQIKRRPILETRSNSQNEPDRILSGYLQITQALLEVSPVQLKATAGGSQSHDLVTMLFQFLFEIPTQQSKQRAVKTVSNLLTASFTPISSQTQAADLPKCKSRTTRKRTFNLLHTLCVGQPANYTKLLASLFTFHKEIQEATKVANDEQIEDFLEGLVNPSSREHAMRASSGYVGLRNFGCTCYMNSLIQQLFMVPELRAGILSAQLPKQIEPTQTEKLVLRELQSTFANLQESVKEFYAPSGFIKAFQFYGQPVNVREQQDTHEFYTNLFAYLESSSPEVATMLKSAVGGVLCNEIKSLEKEFAYLGESEELFSALSLDIKNKRRLQDALDLYVRPDILDGDNKYFCAKHERKVDASKRTYLKSLSDTVVINLKRFEYDYTTLQRIKINDYCEFPELIDFRPWTKQGIEEHEAAQKKRKNKKSGPKAAPKGNEEDEFEDSPGMQEDEEMCDEDIPSDQDQSHGEVDEDGEGSLLGRFSENDAIDSQSENSRPNNTEEGEDNFEDLIDQDGEEVKGALNDKSNAKMRNQTKKTTKAKYGEEQSKQVEKKAKETQQTNEFLYRLVGVLVHSGSANSGHYYSYIKERNENGRWLEFNDRIVKDFEFQNLAKECFGTPPEKNEANKQGSNMHFIQWERHSNAYLLFYERVHPSTKEQPDKMMQKKHPAPISKVDVQKPLPMVDNSDVIMHGESDLSKDDEKPAGASAETKEATDEGTLIKNMTSEHYQGIHAQNQAFMQLKLFYDAEYFQFIRDFVSQFKNTFSSSSQQPEEMKNNPLYFSKSDSESLTLKRLILLTEEFKAEQEQLLAQGAPVDADRYIAAHNAILSEGEAKVLDIFQDPDWAENLQSDPSLTILKFAVTISFDIALKVKDVSGFVQWMQVLEPMFARSAHSCLWLIKYLLENKPALNALLLENPSYEVRESFGRLLKTALNVTIKNEEPYLLEESTYLEFSEASKPLFLTMTQFKSAAIRFCQYFFGEMLDWKVRANWRRYEEYFDILADFTQSSYPVARFMIEKQQAIYRMLEFVMNKQPPFARSNFTKMGNAVGAGVQPSVRQPLDLLSYLIRCTVTSGITTMSKYAPTSVFQDAERNFSIPASEIHFLLRPECWTELLARCADAHSEDAMKALTGIVEHLSWGDRNVSQFFINQLIECIKSKQNKMLAGQAGQAGLPNELDTAFRVLRALLSLQDEPLQKERCNLVFDLQGLYVDSKPLLKILEELRSRNSKFVLYGLAFVAEIALAPSNGDDTHQLTSYLYEHKEQLQVWILQFLEHHESNAASPLSMACAHVIETTLASWRQILQVTEPMVVEEDMELGAAQDQSDTGNNAEAQSQQPFFAAGEGAAQNDLSGSAAFQDARAAFFGDGEAPSGSNQFEIGDVGRPVGGEVDESQQRQQSLEVGHDADTILNNSFENISFEDGNNNKDPPID